MRQHLLLVVSYPCVLATNRSQYAALARRGCDVGLQDDSATRPRLATEGQREVRGLFSLDATVATLEQTLDTARMCRPAARPQEEQTIPRVALVAHGIHDLGGMERACAELIRHLHQRVRFVVVSAELAPELRPFVERWVKIRVPRRPAPLRRVSFFVLAGLALRRNRVNLIHTVGAIVPNRVDVAAVHCCHAAVPPISYRGGWARRLNRRVANLLALAAERWCYRATRVRALAPTSSGTGAEVAGHYPGVPVKVIPNGVDLHRYAPDEADRRALRGTHDAHDDIVVLFVGGDWDRKGLDIAIEAIAKARTTEKTLVLWVVGRGDTARFVAVARDWGVANAVRFFGVSSHTESFYRAADIFVLPSACESFSIPCFEAAACGLPVVVTPISTANVVVGDDEAGVVVARNADSVAQGLLTLADAAVRQRMGAAARRRVQAYTWEASAAATASLYREMIDGTSERRP